MPMISLWCPRCCATEEGHGSSPNGAVRDPPCLKKLTVFTPLLMLTAKAPPVVTISETQPLVTDDRSTPGSTSALWPPSRYDFTRTKKATPSW